MRVMDTKCEMCLYTQTIASMLYLELHDVVSLCGAVDREFFVVVCISYFQCFAIFECRFVSCGGDKQVFLWDVMEGRAIRKFRGHESEVNSVRCFY